MSKWKYYGVVIIELIGIISISMGLIEMQIYHVLNPANFLITLGSATISIGSFIFAKIVNWGKFIQGCKGCYKDEK